MQVRQGEVITSACVIDDSTLKAMYEFNTAIPSDIPASRKHNTEVEGFRWGGVELRLMLPVIYIISFLCLLRYDEALRIEWHWIEFSIIDNQHCMKISLPFRKTHQTGGTITVYVFIHLTD